MSAATARRPARTDYAPHYETCIGPVEDGALPELLARQAAEMQYRALGIARGDRASFPNFDQDPYAEAANADRRPWAGLIDELACVRESSIHLFRHLDAAALDRLGRANDKPVTARALGYAIAGHERYPVAILEARYLGAQAGSLRPSPAVPGATTARSSGSSAAALRS